MSEGSTELPGASSLQWRGPWALQLWLDEPGSDASVELMKTSVAPGETFERAVEVMAGSRVRVLVVSGPDQEFRYKLDVEAEGRDAAAPRAADTRRWSGSTRFHVPLPGGAGRVTMTIETPRSGMACVDFEVAGVGS